PPAPRRRRPPPLDRPDGRGAPLRGVLAGGRGGGVGARRLGDGHEVRARGGRGGRGRVVVLPRGGVPGPAAGGALERGGGVGGGGVGVLPGGGGPGPAGGGARGRGGGVGGEGCV